MTGSFKTNPVSPDAQMRNNRLPNREKPDQPPRPGGRSFAQLLQAAMRQPPRGNKGARNVKNVHHYL